MSVQKPYTGRGRAVPCPTPAWLAWVASLPALAQTGPAAAPADTPTLPPAARQSVVITGNPLRRDDPHQPASVLSGDALTLRRAASLGDTLDGLPGVGSTAFGPSAGRPVIRGMDGDRIRILDNGGASVDASSLSFDHASAIDPLVVERLEVLRGPAALLYGGNATGGVVNAIDNRIPRSPVQGLSGRAEASLGGADAHRRGSLLVEGGGAGWAWHADAYGRRSGELRVPHFVPVGDEGPRAPTDRVADSAATARGGAVGTAWHGPRGFVGLSVDRFENDYGIVVEPGVSIRMRRSRAAAEAQADLGAAGRLEAKASHTRYRHEEVEGSGEVGTTFASRGQDARLEWQHPAWGPLQGVLGLQAENLRFSALGEEAFVPGTRTRSQALFALETWRTGPLQLSAGLRAEQVRVSSDGDAPDALETRFGPAVSRRFQPRSASLGASWAVAPGWTLQASWGRTQRAPAYYELFADGLHLATGAYEVGDPTLSVERSRHAEAGLAWRAGGASFQAQVWRTDFARYIALQATGQRRTVEAEDGGVDDVPEYAFRAVRARLQGIELEGQWRATWGPWALLFGGTADVVRGDDRDAGQPLPRLAPARVRLSVEARRGAWGTGLAWQHLARQTRVPAGEEAVPGSQRLDLWVSWKTRAAGADWTLFARAQNLGDALILSSTSVATVRGLAPQGGRALSVGARAEF